MDASEAVQKSVTDNIFNSYHFHEMSSQFEVCTWNKVSDLPGKGIFIDLQFFIQIVYEIALVKTYLYNP